MPLRYRYRMCLLRWQAPGVLAFRLMIKSRGGALFDIWTQNTGEIRPRDQGGPK